MSCNGNFEQNRRNFWTSTALMVHLCCRSPKTFSFQAVRAGCTVVMARTACTGRAPQGGDPPPKTGGGTAKTVAWRGKVRFLAVAEKTRCKQLLSKQNSFCAPTQLKNCKDTAVWDSNILCPKVVQAMTHLPCFFGGPRNMKNAKIGTPPGPEKNVRGLSKVRLRCDSQT